MIPGLGAQVEGYVLIVPNEHVSAEAELSPASRVRLEDVKRDVGHLLNQAYGPCVFFEHGACVTPYGSGGACIDHVHVHALPTEAQIVQLAGRDLDFQPLPPRSHLGEWRGRPYVAVEDQSGRRFVASGDRVPGQFMRRIIAEAIGSPQEWDYEAFPHHERMRSTVERLRPLFDGLEDTDPRFDQHWTREGPRAPIVYVARAVDNVEPADEVPRIGARLRDTIRAAGFAAVDPVASRFPGSEPAADLQSRAITDYDRVRSDLAWLRRSDALVVDMSRPDWAYIGCVCELVYAHLWRIPTIVITGGTGHETRIWLKYHATKTVSRIDEAVGELQALFGAPSANAP